MKKLITRTNLMIKAIANEDVTAEDIDELVRFHNDEKTRVIIKSYTIGLVAGVGAWEFGKYLGRLVNKKLGD